jgi:hypothetical protein
MFCAPYLNTADGRLATLAPGVSAPSSATITALSYNQAGQYAAANSGTTALAVPGQNPIRA